MRMPQIKDVLPITNGLFQHMDYTFRAEVTKEKLDFLLLSSIGRRNPAPVIDLLRSENEEPDEKLTDAQLTSLAALMLSYYKPKWDKLGDIYDIEYDPIHNYLDQWEDESDGEDENTRTLDSDRADSISNTVQHSNTRTDNLTELETRDLGSSSTRTDNLTELETRNLGSSSTRTDNLTELETRNLANANTRTDNTQTENTGTQGNRGTSSDTDSRWGFNSTNAVNTDSNSGNTSNTRTDNLLETHTGTVGNSGTETGTINTANSGTQSTTGTDTGTGSIGNTGTQSTSGTESGTVSIGNTGTQQNVGSDTTTGTNSREVDETETNAGTNHRERSGKHFGNIGNLTSQKQIQEEIELWKWNYIESILDDAKNFLTLLVYC